MNHRGKRKSGYKRKRKCATSTNALANAANNSGAAANPTKDKSKSKRSHVPVHARRPETRNKFILEAQGEDMSQYHERCRTISSSMDTCLRPRELDVRAALVEICTDFSRALGLLVVSDGVNAEERQPSYKRG